MMVDLRWMRKRHQGLDATEAIYQACCFASGPIMMTTMAALLGGLAACVWDGYRLGAAQAAGITMVGGLLLTRYDAVHDACDLHLSSTTWRAVSKKKAKAEHRESEA